MPRFPQHQNYSKKLAPPSIPPPRRSAEENGEHPQHAARNPRAWRAGGLRALTARLRGCRQVPGRAVPYLHGAPRGHAGPTPPGPEPPRGLSRRAVPSLAARSPALPPCARCPVPTPRRGAQHSAAGKRGFLEAEPAPPARRSSPVPGAHDAHFQGRRCHGQAEMPQRGPCLPGRPPASACSAYSAATPPHPRPSATGHLLSRAGRRRPQLTAPEAPPRHSQEPLRTPGPGWPPGSAPVLPHPCPRHVGTCSPHHGPERSRDAAPTLPSSAGVTAQRLELPGCGAAMRPDAAGAPTCGGAPIFPFSYPGSAAMQFEAQRGSEVDSKVSQTWNRAARAYSWLFSHCFTAITDKTHLVPELLSELRF